MNEKTYAIKKGYIANPALLQTRFDIQACDLWDSENCQVAVYQLAHDLIQQKQLTSVLDVGCSVATKLQEFILPACKDITGVGEKSEIEYCKKTYDFGTWVSDDIENPGIDLQKTFDCIICSDIIEHLRNPDTLLSYVKQYAHEETCIIFSTPDRDVTRGKQDLGPPKNTKHIREWNSKEFSTYLTGNGFQIQSQQLLTGVRDKKLLNVIPTRTIRKDRNTVVCTLKKDSD